MVKDEVINADGAILGRMASVVAKRLLEGWRIAIVNAEKAVITGNPQSIISEYKDFLRKGSIRRPERGPKHPRRPDRMVKRTVRGMLPYKTAHGKEALKRLKVYIGVPEEFKKAPLTMIPEARLKAGFNKPFITIEELAKNLGWRP